MLISHQVTFASAAVDQSNTEGDFPSGYSVFFFSPIGQTFVPATPSINFAQFLLDDEDTDGDGGVVVAELYNGQEQGLPLAESLPVYVPINSPLTVYTFQFSPQSLTVGDTYSLTLNQINDGDAFIYAGEDEYANGVAFSDLADLGGDLYFAEGTTPLLTPEPAGSCLVLMSVSALMARRRR